MTRLRTDQADAVAAALAPVRDALVAAARATAESVRVRVRTEADAAIAAARGQATRMLAEARRLGDEDAAAVLAGERTRAQRRARAVVLRAGREDYEALRVDARAAVARLWTGPDAADLRSRLVTEAQRVLGPDAQIHDAPGGGITAEAGGRRVDLSLAAFTDPCGRCGLPTPGPVMTPATGTVLRVNGPLVEVDRLPGVAMAELIEVGTGRLPAEVVSLRPDRITAQAYEYTGSLAPGDPVRASGRPLCACLGPGLLGGVFDGLLRPLSGGPVWLTPDRSAAPRSATATWTFAPTVAVGADLGPGAVLGGVTDAGPVAHKVLVPPDAAGRVVRLRPAGRYRADEPVAWLDPGDGSEVEVTLATWWPVRRPRPYTERLAAGVPLVTGQRVLDAAFPLVKGGTAAVPGGFGTGKTMLLQQVAKWCDADVIVYVGCGERGNEMADVVAELSELTDPRTGGRLADRTVVIANTSNMPIMAREASIYTGVTVAEYYRDMGHHAVVIADSTSRWAEALREFASRTGALPAEEGYPAGLGSALAAFYERAALVTTLGGDTGSVTVIGAVSPPGGDLTEPVTAHTQRFVRTVWTLDRDLAYGRHYPAVAWAGSYCRDAATVGAWHRRNGDPGWAARRARMVATLTEADRLADLADLVGAAALPGRERMGLLAGRLLREAVLQQSALSSTDAYCPPARSAALVDLVLDVAARCAELVDAGVPPDRIEECDFSPVLRAREDAGPDDAAAVRAMGAAMLRRLGELTP